MAKYEHKTRIETASGITELEVVDQRIGSETRLVINQLQEIVETLKWTGRSGMSDKLIMHAHLALAYDKNNFEYHASCRHLALIAGVNHMTAIAATKRLIELSFLVMTEPHDKETFFANKYSITMYEHIVKL